MTFILERSGQWSYPIISIVFLSKQKIKFLVAVIALSQLITAVETTYVESSSGRQSKIFFTWSFLKDIIKLAAARML